MSNQLPAVIAIFAPLLSLLPTEATQPEVNDPPKFESVEVDFPVSEGNLPGIDTDEPRTCVRIPVTVTFLITDPDGDAVTVMVDLDEDGKFDDFVRKTQSGNKIIMIKKFEKPGDFIVNYKACDARNLCTSVLNFKIGMVLCPPRIVEFATKTKRIGVGDKVFMTLRASDAQEDRVRYEIDWDDDGDFEQKTPYYQPQKRITVSHAFQQSGLHVVSARCCDELDGCSRVERRTLVVRSLNEAD